MNPMTWDAPYPIIVGAMFVIVFLRANATYWLGRLLQHGAGRTRLAHRMESPAYLRATEAINQWGPPVVAISFLTIGFQTMVNLAAGATRMPLARYLPAMALGCLAWAFLYGTAGFVGLEAFILLWQRDHVLAVAFGVLVVAALAAFVVVRVRKRERRPPAGVDAV